MKRKYDNINILLLKEIVANSDSFVEVTNKLGLNPNLGSTKKNIKRLIKRNKLSVEHFSSVQQLKKTKINYNKTNLINLVKESLTLKEILIKLDLLPVEANYKTLKKYLNLYKIDYSNILKGVEKKSTTRADYNKENLKKIVLESNTFTEVLIKLGLVPRGSNYKTLYKYINKYNINTDKFIPNKIRINKLKLFNTFLLTDILIENSTYTNTTNLKNKLYDAGLKKPICEKCGQNDWWYGEKISLIIDHINGIHTDNRLENLRIVCPNCNATLPTHCGKNIKLMKNITYCSCGKIIGNKSKICVDCSNKNKRKVDRPSFEKLSQDIKELGYSATGRKYAVSDNCIRKWCKQYEKII